MLTLSSVFIGVWFVILTAVNSPVYALDHLLGEQCSLYIAASTIPAAGLGFFTGIERQAGAVLGYGDVMIPLSDQVYHFQALGSDAWQRSDWNFVDPTADYLWYGPELGMHRESAHPQAQYEFALGYASGMDAVINCNLGLINVDKDFPKYDFSGLHRSRDPGAGAFTPYHGCPTYTTNYVPAGGELFKDYGEDWFTSREAIFGLIPLTDDYPIAEEVVQSLHRILETRNVTTAARRDIWRLTTNSPWVEESRTLRAIPNAYENLELIATQGIRAAYQPQATRPIHELHEKGRCADAIRPQPSTLHQAGRGAFSTRPFLPNQIVTGTPMLFFPTAVNFEMYEGDWFTKSLEDFYPDSIQGYQLLYNYCWHPDKNISSIYMCPYGSGINYINHNQTRANVRLQWAPDGEMNHDASLLQSHPSKMYYQSAPRLWMDIVATREIADDEELFLDYGDAWERAWQDHANEWAEHEFPEDYESAHDWNLNNTATILKTLEEQKADPYPENFVLTCLPEIANWSMAEALTSNVARKLWEPSVVGFPCHVFERELQSNGDYWYRVAYRELEWPVPLTFHDTDTWDYSYWIIREAMRFQEAPYTSDIFLEEAFRHPMGFPDDVFPEAWRDVFLAPLPGMQPRVIV